MYKNIIIAGLMTTAATGCSEWRMHHPNYSLYYDNAKYTPSYVYPTDPQPTLARKP